MTSVLVVEDNDEVANIFRAILEGAGYDVGRSSNGAEAITKATHAPYDLVLMDLMMSHGIGGVEAARTMRGFGYTGSIIAITGAEQPRGDDAAPFDGLLSKPVMPKDLLAEVKRVLG